MSRVRFEFEGTVDTVAVPALRKFLSTLYEGGFVQDLEIHEEPVEEPVRIIPEVEA